MDEFIHFEVALKINVTISSMQLKLYLVWKHKIIFIKCCSKLPVLVG